MLNIKDFTTALEIISKSHSTELAINIPKNNFVGNMGQTEFRLHIKKCVPSVINNLIQVGYILNMGPEGLEVDKMRIVLTLVNSNLGLYITYLQN